MATAAAVVVCVVLAALAVLQIAAAAGRPVGRFVWGGQHEVLPTHLRIGSAVSVLLYLAMALIVLDRAGLIDVVGDDVARVGTWVLTGYFALGVVLNGLSRSRSERAVMTPTCLLLAVSCFVVATS